MPSCILDGMARTTIAVNPANRDALAKIAAEQGGVSLDEALRSLIWEHEFHASLARLDADPEALADYQREAQALAEGGLEIIE